MKTEYVIGFSLIAGAVIGASAVGGLRAQTKPPVFQITLQEVNNPDAFAKEFVPVARASVRQGGGRVVASGIPVAVEGTAPKNRVVINQWDSLKQLQAWYKGAEYQKAREFGNKYATFQIMAVEGVPPQ